MNDATPDPILPVTRYCPTCDAPRTPEQQDDFGHCRVCGTELLDDRDASTVAFPAPEEEAAREEPREREAAPVEDPREQAETRLAEVIRQEREERAEREQREARQRQDQEERAWQQRRAENLEEERRREERQREEQRRQGEGTDRGTTPPPPPPPPGTGAETRRTTVSPPDLEGTQRVEVPADVRTIDYDKLVGEVERNVREGFDLFGLVGGSHSGKTHALKALTYLLKSGGTQSDRAAFEFMKAPTPGQTGAEVFHYDYQGGGRRWTFVDAGGELYARLRRNDWNLVEGSTRLSRWLFNAHGLFCFVHLRPGHFGGPILDVDPTLEEDEARRQELTKRLEEARADQQELAFFRNLFLFLRALQAENGDIATVIERCRYQGQGNLGEALQEYAASAPLLDVPVMFFFTKADRYDREDFAVGRGVYLKPRKLKMPTPVFTARYLPTLFDGVASQVKRFKFDFLQSYEEAETGRHDSRGVPVVRTYWQAPDDPHQHLSMGLLSGLEFVLRNQPRERRAWRPAAITTRQALILHRLLHPGQWTGVRRGILGSWRHPSPTAPAPGAGTAAPAETPPGGGR